MIKVPVGGIFCHFPRIVERWPSLTSKRHYLMVRRAISSRDRSLDQPVTRTFAQFAKGLLHLTRYASHYSACTPGYYTCYSSTYSVMSSWILDTFFVYICPPFVQTTLKQRTWQIDGYLFAAGRRRKKNEDVQQRQLSMLRKGKRKEPISQRSLVHY
jgi:hypothetical protein